MISCNFSTIVNNTRPKFAFKRDKSLIVNSIAPKHKIQLSKKFVPYMNSQIRDRIREQKRLLDIFKRTKSKSDPTIFLKKFKGARQMV